MPGTSMSAFDYSEFVKNLSVTRVAVVGGATKGALNEPTRIRSDAELIEKFGFPMTTDYGLQAALVYLKEGGDLIFVRTGVSAGLVGGVVTADRSLPGTEILITGVAATGSVTSTTDVQPVDGDFITISEDGGATSLDFEFDDNAAIAGDVGVRIGADLHETMMNLAAAINLTFTNIIAADPILVALHESVLLEHTLTGVAYNDAIVNTPVGAGGTTGWTMVGLAGGVTETYGASVSAITVSAVSPGTWGNAIAVVASAPSAGTGIDLDVYCAPVYGATAAVVESFKNLSLLSTDARYITNVMLYGIEGEVNASEYIRVVVGATTYSVTTGATSYTLGAGGGVPGEDGLGIADYLASVVVGGMSGLTATGLQTLKNAYKISIDAIAAPGWSHGDVVDELIAIATTRADCIAVIDPPLAIDPAKLAEWVDGTGPLGVPNPPAAILNSASAMCSEWWVETYDPYNKRKLWLPPSGYVMQALAINDRDGAPWLPPAGLQRGAVSGGLRVEYSPTDAETETLYEHGVNVFLQFMDAEHAIIHFGNRTLLRTASKRRSLHIQRMLLYLYKALGGARNFLVFDPNDPVTWRKWAMMAEKVLMQIQAGRGLRSDTPNGRGFSVQCDATTNPEEQRQRREMRGRLVLWPMDMAESIVVDFAITQSAAVFTETVGGVLA